MLPYRNILNSGSFLLSQTFGLPVVAPRAGAIAQGRSLRPATALDDSVVASEQELADADAGGDRERVRRLYYLSVPPKAALSVIQTLAAADAARIASS